MLYNKKNIQIPLNDELNIYGCLSHDLNRYVSPCLSGVYIESSQNAYAPQSSNKDYLKYVINMIPYRAASNISLYAEIYKGTIIEAPIVKVISKNISFNSLFGVVLDEAAKCALINISNASITTENYLKEYCIFNYKLNVVFETKSASNGTEFIYFENCIFMQDVDVKYSSLLHPLELTAYKGLYNILEAGSVPTIRFKNFATSNRMSGINYVNLYKLRMLFSSDGVIWYKYNTSSAAFEIVTPSSTYFTFSELCTVGTSYKEYTEIPFKKYQYTFGSTITDLKVLSNGWILPRFIRHSFFKDKSDSSQFLWVNTNNTSKASLFLGDM